MRQSIDKAGMLLAVAGEEEDVVEDGSSDGDGDDRHFWICRTEAPARKLQKQFAEDCMVIPAKQWAVDVRWFKVRRHLIEGVHYKKEAGGVCTIPVKSCLKVDGLEWKNESTTGNLGVLSHDDYERLEEQWKLEVLRK
jgi:hypothetical protein